MSVATPQTSPVADLQTMWDLRFHHAFRQGSNRDNYTRGGMDAFLVSDWGDEIIMQDREDLRALVPLQMAHLERVGLTPGTPRFVEDLVAPDLPEGWTFRPRQWNLAYMPENIRDNPRYKMPAEFVQRVNNKAKFTRWLDTVGLRGLLIPTLILGEDEELGRLPWRAVAVKRPDEYQGDHPVVLGLTGDGIGRQVEAYRPGEVVISQMFGDQSLSTQYEGVTDYLGRRHCIDRGTTGELHDGVANKGNVVDPDTTGEWGQLTDPIADAALEEGMDGPFGFDIQVRKAKLEAGLPRRGKVNEANFRPTGPWGSQVVAERFGRKKLYLERLTVNFASTPEEMYARMAELGRRLEFDQNTGQGLIVVNPAFFPTVTFLALSKEDDPTRPPAAVFRRAMDRLGQRSDNK